MTYLIGLALWLSPIAFYALFVLWLSRFRIAGKHQ
jgi:hypothetical protein